MLVDRFVTEEVDDATRAVIRAAMDGDVGVEQLELNLFDLRVDRAQRLAVLEDALDPDVAPVTLTFRELQALLAT